MSNSRREKMVVWPIRKSAVSFGRIASEELEEHANVPS